MLNVQKMIKFVFKWHNFAFNYKWFCILSFLRPPHNIKQSYEVKFGINIPIIKTVISKILISPHIFMNATPDKLFRD